MALGVMARRAVAVALKSGDLGSVATHLLGIKNTTHAPQILVFCWIVRSDRLADQQVVKLRPLVDLVSRLIQPLLNCGFVVLGA